MACFWTNLTGVKQDCGEDPPEPGTTYPVFLAGYQSGVSGGYLVSTGWPVYNPHFEEDPIPPAGMQIIPFEGGSALSLSRHGGVHNGAVYSFGGAIFLVPDALETTVEYDDHTVAVSVRSRIEWPLIMVESEENQPGEKEWKIWDRFPVNLGLNFNSDIGPFTIGDMPFVWSGPGSGYKLDQAAMTEMEMELPEMSMCGEYLFYHEASETEIWVVMVCWFTPPEEG